MRTLSHLYIIFREMKRLAKETNLFHQGSSGDMFFRQNFELLILIRAIQFESSRPLDTASFNINASLNISTFLS
jgi:hypothetical protein